MHNKIAIIAGKGLLPLEIIKKCESLNHPFFIVAIEGETEKELLNQRNHQYFYIGEINKIVSSLHREQVDTVILAGAMKKPALTKIKLDSGGINLMKEITKRSLFGDNSILSTIIKFLEKEGFKVIGAHEFLDNIVAEKKIFTKIHPNEEQERDIKLGIRTLEHLSSLDIGQALIIENGIILGIEAAEGTDQLIIRCRDLSKNKQSILIKLPKLGQEKRADLPTIGPTTIELAKECDLSGIIIKAGGSIILKKEEVIDLADRYNLFLVGV